MNSLFNAEDAIRPIDFISTNILCLGLSCSSPDFYSSKLLAIPPRLQWDDNNGYCGETSIQTLALYYGAWISQKTIRDIGGGEILLGDNMEPVLTTLGFDYESWDNNKESPQFENFMAWLKGHLLKGNPGIFAVYLSDAGEDDSAYDHIEPVIGVVGQGNSSFNLNDRLFFYNNFDYKYMNRSFAHLSSTRKNCSSDLAHGGCVPKDTDYGVVLKGIIDQDHATYPLQLFVDTWDEPNLSKKENPKKMYGSVFISKLTVGNWYYLLRYDSHDVVPKSGDAAAFLNSNFVTKTKFQACQSFWYYSDPNPFSSASTVYYRVVEVN